MLFWKIWSRKKVSVSENLVSEKSFGFGKFGLEKKTDMLTLTFYPGGAEKEGKNSEMENIFFLRRRKTEKENEENIGEVLSKYCRGY